jgi:hypothetical protein
MRKITIVPVAVLVAGLSLAACGGHSSGKSAADAASARAHASAIATAPGAKLTETDAKALAARCFPVSNTAKQIQLASPGTAGHNERVAVLTACGVPKANRAAAASLLLYNTEHNVGGPMTKGHRETSLINDAYPVLVKYHGTVTP